MRYWKGFYIFIAFILSVMFRPSCFSAAVGKQMLIFLIFFLAGNAASAQTANFTANVYSGCFPLTVQFTNSTIGTTTSLSWDLGNGNFSPLANPSAVYPAAGTYTVKLTAFNGTHSSVKTALIIVHDAPDVDFSFDKNSGCSPLGVVFKNLSTSSSGTITDWFWDFGDGGTSNIADPTHVYTTSGPRSVMLKVKSQYGCEATETKASAINVQGPKADFTASNTQLCQVPAKIDFDNLSTGAVSFDWDFGDGKKSNAVEPSNTYTKAGSYQVQLKAFDVQGCESSHTITVNAGSEGGLRFIPSASKVCIGEAVTFTVESDAPIISRSWDFDNGTSSTSENALVAYTDKGTYSVTLEALLIGKSCHSVVTKEIEVLADPQPLFTYRSDCNYNATFTSTSVAATRLEWYIGNVLYSTLPSFVYSFGASGTYGIKLIAYNALNCSKTLEQNISIAGKPVAAFLPNKEQDCIEPSLSGCAPFNVQFTNKSDANGSAFTSLWDFGDASPTVDTKEPAHTYAKGNFTVSLRITNAQGCTSITSAKVTVADPAQGPVARFIMDKTEVCSREPVKFTSQSQNANFWCWDFGDGTTDIGSQVTHRYKEPGVYTVRLIAKNAGCSDFFEIVNAVKVNAPLVDYKIEKNCADPYTISLQNNSSLYDTFEWDFGDNKPKINTHIPGYRYTSTGDYSVTLSVTNNTTHCTVAVSTTISILDIKADFEIDNDKPCKGAPVKFKDKSEYAVSWEWTFGDGTTSSSQNPTMSYKNSGAFGARLRVYDADKCYEDKILPVNVLNMHGDFGFSATSTCDDLTVKFKDYSTGTPLITDWHWDFGDGQTSDDTEPEHVYTDVGNYPVTVTITNAEGDCSFIKYDAVRFTNPIPDFTAPKPGYCMDERIVITNWSRDAVAYKWDFGNGRGSTDVHAQVSYKATGSYPVTLSATDAYGCERMVTKTAFISITKPVAAFKASETEGACPPLTSIFQNLSTGNVVSSHWDFGNGSYSIFSDPVNTYLRPGIFDVKLTVTDKNGCRDTTVMEKLIRVGGPDGSFISDLAAPSCINANVQFTATTTNTTVHRWDYGDGNVEDLADQNTAHLYTGPGSYNTSLVLIDDKGCKVVAQGKEKIIVSDTTKIAFKYSPTCIFQGDAFSLKAEAAEAVDWTWEINGHAAGTQAVQEVTLDTAGEHRVVLRATNRYGCTSTISDTVVVHGNITFIPNIFTPNNDTYNERFEVENLEKSRWDLDIYNRWGNPVYKKNNYVNDWDGGGLATGVYYYKLSNAFCDREYKGHVTIAR